MLVCRDLSYLLHYSYFFSLLTAHTPCFSSLVKNLSYVLVARHVLVHNNKMEINNTSTIKIYHNFKEQDIFWCMTTR